MTWLLHQSHGPRGVCVLQVSLKHNKIILWIAAMHEAGTILIKVVIVLTKLSFDSCSSTADCT